VACFLAQQSAEKYLKARIHEAGIAIPRTHDLVLLLGLVLPLEPLWAVHTGLCQTLTTYGVAVRYPGTSVDKVKVKEAIGAAKEIRISARTALGLS
jgi:HEPN domain-containing protein